ncbi:hypothetical protein ACFWUQ_18555 [Streptomyces sp. NPDC058662]|uniref:hypothetical protein n=1 Tax=Streptomyces sp. NPDC058662 TaxID=3346583 RepID=UPI0036545C41
MPTAEEDRASRRLAWCVAHLLRHAPDRVVMDLVGRLDPAARKYLCRDAWLPASTVTLLLRHGSEGDRHYIARNPRVVGRPLPGLRGPELYAARTASQELRRAVAAELGRDPAAGLTAEELVAQLRRHGGRRPRAALDVLTFPHERDPDLLLREHAAAPLPTGAVEALLLVADLPRDVGLALLDTRAVPVHRRHWHRPAVRAVRMGLLTHEELVAHVAPAHRTLLLGHLPERSGLRWTLPEQAGMRTAVARALGPLGDDPRVWSELARYAAGFPGTLPELVSAVAAGTVQPQPQPPQQPEPDPDPWLTRAVRHFAPAPAPEPSGDVEYELALASLAVPMEDVREDIRWVRDCLARGVLTGADVIRHKLPACWALDEDHWLGDVDHPDRHDRPAAVLDARAEADRLFAAALDDDPDAWWRAARALPHFTGTLPELLARPTDGDSVSEPF